MPTYRVQDARAPPENQEFVRIPRRRDVFLETLALSVTTVLLVVNGVFSLFSWWGDSASLGMGRSGTRESLTQRFSVTPFAPASWTYAAWSVVFASQFAVLGHAWSYACRQKVERASSPLLYPVLCLAYLVNVGYVYAVGHSAAELSLALISVEALASCVCVAVVAVSLRWKETGLADLGPFDKWYTRLISLNALSLSAAWTLTCVLFHISSVLSEDSNLHEETIATCLLSLLGAATVSYFLLEATILDRYLRFVYIVCPIVVWWLGGVLARQWDGEFGDISRNNLFAFVLLVVFCGLFVVRLVLIVLFGCFRRQLGGGSKDDIMGLALIPYS